MKNALVLIDIQNDYFIGGKNELYLTKEAAENASKVLNYFRNANLPIFHIKHISGANAAFFLPDTYGAEINDIVAPMNDEKVIVKHAPNAFLKTNLADELRKQEISNLIICGMMSHMCIDTTVRAAMDNGFTVTLLEDACTTKNLIWGDDKIPAQTVQKTIMASLNGVFAKVTKTDKFLESSKNNN
ncbi:MAG: cysteine hydrolase [Eubacteriaceae bacterium]|nr:cysteine hydrolase [Eubacteriaceae bacterium]